MKTGTCFVFSLSLLFSVSGMAVAQSYDGQPRLLLHRVDVTSKNVCDAGGLSNCRDADISGTLTVPGVGPYHYAYVVAARGSLPDLSALGFGIYYERGYSVDVSNGRGVDVLAWTLCADAETTSPAWPGPYTGNTITWDAGNCQTGELAVAGYLYVAAYSPDRLGLTVQPNTDELSLTTCGGETWDPGSGGFGLILFSRDGQATGYNPCCAPEEPCGTFPNPDPVRYGPKIMVHVTDPISKNACTIGGLVGCTDANTRGGLYASSGGQYAYLLAVRTYEMTLAGLQCGIFYDGGTANGAANHRGLDVFSWTLCADLEFPMPAWPQPGSGNLITWSPWNNCQSVETVAMAGYFYVGAYSPDILQVTPHPLVSLAKVADCGAAETIVPEEDLGSAAFSAGGATAGCNPCVVSCTQPIPVEVTTWGNIKTLFGR